MITVLIVLGLTTLYGFGAGISAFLISDTFGWDGIDTVLISILWPAVLPGVWVYSRLKNKADRLEAQEIEDKKLISEIGL